MFDHLSLGVTDLNASLRFYDAALKPLGISQMFALADRGIAAYRGAGESSFWLYSKTSEQTALGEILVMPRFHLAFKAASREAVDQFYAAAIAQGGQDAGAPGLRQHYHPNYYAAYVLDPSGYKIEAVCQQG